MVLLMIDLDSREAGDPLRTGVKAATLAQLRAAGFAVPAGIVITSDARAASDDELAVALLAATERIGPGPFAVRSSALAEDLPTASYAGLYETYLMTAPSDLVPSVRACFASATADRVHHYRGAGTHAANPTDSAAGSDGEAMAVLIQPMVDAIAAGVAFTANPLTGDRSETVVIAVPGVGAAVVSGEATGEEWVIRDGRAELTREASKPALRVDAALRVAGLARRVARRCATPQDVEWAIDRRGRLWLLQARPMTALPDPMTWDIPGPGLWSRNFRLGEWLPEPMTPLFADWGLPRIEAGYLDAMRPALGVVVPFRYSVVNGWYYNAPPLPSLRLLARVLLASRGRAPRFIFYALIQVSRNPAAADRALLSDLYRQWRDLTLPGYRQLAERASAESVAAGPTRLLELIDQLAGCAGQYLFSLAVVGGSAWKMEGRLRRFLRTQLPDLVQADAATLLSGLPGSEPRLPAHAVLSLDWYWPTTGELSQDGVANDPGREIAAEDRQLRIASDRTAAERACRAQLAARPALLLRFDELLRVAQRYAVIREQQARDLSLGWPALRNCLSRLGDHLIAAGVIVRSDDIHFLTLRELQAALDGDLVSRAAPVGARRETWRQQRRLAAPLTLGRAPRLIGDPVARTGNSARTVSAPRPGAAGEVIVGHPASPGRATGAVRIVHGPADFASFTDGEILVAKATAPAWTPLFDRAVAVVTDTGSLAAHASLLAREYGIPAVVGTGSATSRLRNGMTVTVDGQAGTVRWRAAGPPESPT